MNPEEMIEYLYSHIEIEHIMLDCFDRYGVEELELLTVGQLVELATAYNYFD